MAVLFIKAVGGAIGGILMVMVLVLAGLALGVALSFSALCTLIQGDW